MKKTEKKKLALSKETLTQLEQVTGGSNLYYTVIIIRQSDECFTNACSPVYA